jgi:hypothetical protein
MTQLYICGSTLYWSHAEILDLVFNLKCVYFNYFILDTNFFTKIGTNSQKKERQLIFRHHRRAVNINIFSPSFKTKVNDLT